MLAMPPADPVPAVRTAVGALPGTGVNHCGSSRCAQPGDNLVDQWSVSVGRATLPWDGVWGQVETAAIVPSQFTDQASPSTIVPRYYLLADLRKG
jgi:hypothetical protein